MPDSPVISHEFSKMSQTKGVVGSINAPESPKEEPGDEKYEGKPVREEVIDNGKGELKIGTPMNTEAGRSTDILDLTADSTSTKVDSEKNDVETGTVEDRVTGRPPGTRYLDPKELAWISFAFSLASFMIALDSSILGTAIPKITSEFNSLGDFGWYGSAYMLTEMSFQPSWGRAYSYFDRKWLYMITLILFEVGSIICAAAPNSIALIIGRAITGAGGSGMLCGSLAIFGQSVPLKQRPFGMAIVTSVFSIAALLGPTVGGVFVDTRQLTWRFCFWINFPVGFVCGVITWWVLKPQPAPQGDLPLREKIYKLDLPGAVILTAGIIALFIALTWGGDKYRWSNPKVYGCLIVFGVLIVIFFIVQFRKGEDATIPMRILTQRTVWLSCLYNAMYAMTSMVHGYYLSFYFQSVLGTSAAMAGVRGLPYTIFAGIFCIVSGWSMSNQGYYVPFMWLGAGVYTIGAGLMYTFSIDSSIVKWLGYQTIAGIGFGLSCSIPFIAVQVVLPDDDMPIACSWVVFFRVLGGAVGISIGENIFSTTLLSKLRKIPGLDVAAVIRIGAANANLVEYVPASMLLAVRVAYNSAVRNAFVLSIAAAGVAFVSSLFMERMRILDDEVPQASPTPNSEQSTTESKDVLKADEEKTVQREVDSKVA